MIGDQLIDIQNIPNENVPDQPIPAPNIVNHTLPDTSGNYFQDAILITLLLAEYRQNVALNKVSRYSGTNRPDTAPINMKR